MTAGDPIRELLELLERAEGAYDSDPGEIRAAVSRSPLFVTFGQGDYMPVPGTGWQGFAWELRNLCRRVLTEADEQSAIAFWELLIEVAALTARRIPGERPPWR
jgi:hypothetical protein